MFMGGILLHPTFLQMAAEGASIKVYGISATPQNYASTIANNSYSMGNVLC